MDSESSTTATVLLTGISKCPDVLNQVSADGKVIAAHQCGLLFGHFGSCEYPDLIMPGEGDPEAGPVVPIDPWDLIEVFGLDYFLGGALELLLRVQPSVEDLKKAVRCIEKRIEIEGKRNEV